MELTESQRSTIRRLHRKGYSSLEIAEKKGLDKGTVAAYVANITRKKEMAKIKKRLLIIECTSETKEEKSESLLLKELIRILKPTVQPRIVKARGRRGFVRELEAADELFIHVSAHGRYRKGKRVHGTFIHFPSGKRISSIEVKEILGRKSRREKPRLVVLSACEAGHRDMAKALYDGGCRYFVAPTKPTYWFDAAVFLTIFYRFLLVEDNGPWVAFKKTSFALKKAFPYLSGSWSYYEDGKKVAYEE